MFIENYEVHNRKLGGVWRGILSIPRQTPPYLSIINIRVVHVVFPVKGTAQTPNLHHQYINAILETELSAAKKRYTEHFRAKALPSNTEYPPGPERVNELVSEPFCKYTTILVAPVPSTMMTENGPSTVDVADAAIPSLLGLSPLTL